MSRQTPGQRHSADELLEDLAEVARRLSAADSLDELLQRIVDLGAEHLDQCDGVSLMLIGKGGKVSTPAYSSPVARDSDLAQFETDEGPCLEAIRERETVIIDDLETEERWPAYRSAALKLGVRSMLSIRLFMHENNLGALDFYAAAPHAFGRWSQMLGQVFASHAAVALKCAIAEAGLHAAIRSRDVIGQAKGVIMERDGLTAEAAFARLREISQHHNRALADIAEDIADTGELPGGAGSAPASA